MGPVFPREPRNRIPACGKCAETGLYRFYSPRVGRWVSRDPIGDLGTSWFRPLSGGVDGRRPRILYSFCRNKTPSVIDALGLEECPPADPGLFGCNEGDSRTLWQNCQAEGGEYTGG